MNKARGGRPNQRQLRVGEEVRHALVRILHRGGIRDPELTDAQVTVTEVRMSPDLRSATAYVVPFGGGDAGRLAEALNRAASFLRAQLASELSLRVLPSLRFTPDYSFERANRIERLLHDPRVARDLPDAGEGPEPRREDEDGT